MNSETYNRLPDQVVGRITQLTEEQLAPLPGTGRLSSEKLRAEIANELKAKAEAGEVLILSDEEERLLKSFRAFKATAQKQGVVFKWQTGPEGLVVEPPQQFVVTDPQDVSR